MAVSVRFASVLFIGLAFALPTLAASETTADEIVAKSIAAQGGRESWAAIETIVVSGEYSTFSSKGPFKLYRKRSRLYRFEFKYADWDMILGYDGSKPWWIDKRIFGLVDWPIVPSVAHGRDIEGDVPFGSPLLEHAEKGLHRVEYAGESDVDGQACHELHVALENKSNETWYLDAETFLPFARVSIGAELEQEFEKWTYFSDYREVAGVKFPYRIEVEMGSRYQLMEVKDISLNTELEDSLFAFAITPQMQRLEKLAGKWEVKVQSRRFPTEPWHEHTTTGVIRSSLHGHLLEEELSFVAYTYPRDVRRWISYDRFQDVYRITYIDTLSTHVNVLEGDWVEGRLVTTNLKTGTIWGARGQNRHSREILYDLHDDRFMLDRDISMDNGETWLTVERFSYVRLE